MDLRKKVTGRCRNHRCVWARRRPSPSRGLAGGRISSLSCVFTVANLQMENEFVKLDTLTEAPQELPADELPGDELPTDELPTDKLASLEPDLGGNIHADSPLLRLQPPSPPGLLTADAADAAFPPNTSPFGQSSNIILAALVVIMLRCFWAKHRAQADKMLTCALRLVAVGPLSGPATSAVQKLERSGRSQRRRAGDEGLEAGFGSDEEIDEIDDEAELLTGKPGAKGKSRRPRQRDPLSKDAKAAAPKPQSRSECSRSKGGAEDYEADEVEEIDDVDDDDEVEEIDDVDDDDEVEEVDDDEDADEVEEVEEVEEEFEPVRRHGRGNIERYEDDEDDVREAAAIKSKLAELESKLAQGGTITLSDLAGHSRASVDGSGNFALPGQGADRGANDDSFTMVGLNAQVCQPRNDVETDRRQAKLEMALRHKQERFAKQAAAELDQLKRQARRALRPELLKMDQELERLLRVQSVEGDSYLATAWWLLEYAYTNHPPRSFSKARAEEESRIVRHLRFRDATVRALKLLQARYAPEKNSAQSHGAEWAVLAEEIAKHAFSLTAGVSRSSRQELLPTSSIMTAKATSSCNSHDESNPFSLNSMDAE